MLRLRGHQQEARNEQQYPVHSTAPAQGTKIQDRCQQHEEVRCNIHVKRVQVTHVGDITKHEQNRQTETVLRPSPKVGQQPHKKDDCQEKQRAVNEPHMPQIEAATPGKHGTEGQRRHDQNEFGRKEPVFIEVAGIEIVLGIGEAKLVFSWSSETKAP